MIANQFTNIDGSSNWFAGSLVLFNNELLKSLLDIDVPKNIFSESFSKELAAKSNKYSDNGIIISIISDSVTNTIYLTIVNKLMKTSIASKFIISNKRDLTKEIIEKINYLIIFNNIL